VPDGRDYFYTLQEICVLLNLLPNSFRQIAREFPDLVQVQEEVRKGRTVLGLPQRDFEVLRAIVQMRGRGLSGDEIREALRRGIPLEAETERSDAGQERPGEATAEGPRAAAAPASGPASLDDAVGRSLVGDAFQEGGGSEEPAHGGNGRVGDLDETAVAADDVHTANRLAVERALAAEIAALKGELLKMDQRRREERDKLLTALMRTQRELRTLRYEVGLTLSRRERKKRRGFWAWLFDL